MAAIANCKTVAEMRKWLKNNDPVYGGHIGWINKVNSYGDGQVIAVYRSRQEAIAKEEAKKKVEEDAKKGLPTIIEDIPEYRLSNSSSLDDLGFIKSWNQLTLMDIFGEEMRKTHYDNCEKVTNYGEEG